MNTYPRDEFDDIEENSSRRGAYRGRVADTSTSRAGLLAIVISGIFALLVGGVMYVVSPRTAGPGAEPASVNASATAPESTIASATPSAESSPSTDPASVKVAVYNSSAPEGSAGIATSILQKANYKVTETANWAGDYTAESMVYFATGSSSEANEIADMLGIPYINQDFHAKAGEIYVVLGEDFKPVTPTSEPDETGATSGTTDNPSDNNQTFYVYDSASGSYVVTTQEAALAAGQTLYVLDPATGTYTEYSASPATADTGVGVDNVQRYSLDPATGAYVPDPAGTYVYDAATGTYRQG